MNTSPTPETDAAFTSKCRRYQIVNGDHVYYDEDHVPADFARKLERERDEAQKALHNTNGNCSKCSCELNQLRKVCDELAFHLSCVHKETGCASQCSVTTALNKYNNLLHVKQAKGQQ